MTTSADTIPLSLGYLKSRLTPFCQRHGVARLEVFGSVARGETRPGSDLDYWSPFVRKYTWGGIFSRSTRRWKRSSAAKSIC
jgi:predicted nucleotidyltransferase